MACDATDVELAEFAAGDLPVERAGAVERHLARCADCRRRLDVLRRADAWLRLLPRQEPPARTILKVRRALRDEIQGADGPEIMTLGEVAASLRIAPEDLDEIAEDLPAFELAGQVRVRRARLLEWIEQRERRYSMSNAECNVARITTGRFGKGVA